MIWSTQVLLTLSMASHQIFEINSILPSTNQLSRWTVAVNVIENVSNIKVCILPFIDRIVIHWKRFFFCNLKIWRVTQLIISNIFPIRTCLEQKSIGTGRSEWVNNYSDSAVGRNMTKGSSKHGLFIKQHVQFTLKLDPNLISIWNITIMGWN